MPPIPAFPTDHPKTDIDKDTVTIPDQAAAECRAAIARCGEPAAASRGGALGIPIICPGTAISRRSLIGFMPVISTPLPDIPVHIIESKSIRGKLAYRGCFS